MKFAKPAAVHWKKLFGGVAAFVAVAASVGGIKSAWPDETRTVWSWTQPARNWITGLYPFWTTVVLIAVVAGLLGTNLFRSRFVEYTDEDRNADLRRYKKIFELFDSNTRSFVRDQDFGDRFPDSDMDDLRAYERWTVDGSVRFLNRKLDSTYRELTNAVVDLNSAVAEFTGLSVSPSSFLRREISNYDAEQLPVASDSQNPQLTQGEWYERRSLMNTSAQRVHKSLGAMIQVGQSVFRGSFPDIT